MLVAPSAGLDAHTCAVLSHGVHARAEAHCARRQSVQEGVQQLPAAHASQFVRAPTACIQWEPSEQLAVASAELNPAGDKSRQGLLHIKGAESHAAMAVFEAERGVTVSAAAMLQPSVPGQSYHRVHALSNL